VIGLADDWVVPEASSPLDYVGVAKEADEEGLDDEELEDEGYPHGRQPVPAVIVRVTRKTWQSVDC